MVTRLRQASEGWLAILLQLLVLLNHYLVHKFLDNEQFGESSNTAAVCSEVTS